MLAECRDLLGIIEASLIVAPPSFPFNLSFLHIQPDLHGLLSVMASWLHRGARTHDRKLSGQRANPYAGSTNRFGPRRPAWASSFFSWRLERKKPSMAKHLPSDQCQDSTSPAEMWAGSNSKLISEDSRFALRLNDWLLIMDISLRPRQLVVVATPTEALTRMQKGSTKGACPPPSVSFFLVASLTCKALLS